VYKIKSTENLKKMMEEYFLSLDSGKKKVAWCTSVGPAELLRSFGFEVFFPENHGALLGASRTAMDYIPEAIKCGYSGHICSYTTADIGSYLKKERNTSSKIFGRGDSGRSGFSGETNEKNDSCLRRSKWEKI